MPGPDQGGSSPGLRIEIVEETLIRLAATFSRG